MLLFFSQYRFFSATNSDAIAVLGTLVQSSSVLIAIVFAFLIFITQTIVGKYVSGVLDYIFMNSEFVVTFVFYTSTTLTIVISFWLYSISHYPPLVDLSISLFIIQIVLLPILFFVQMQLLNPKKIVESLLFKLDLSHDKKIAEATEQIKLVFSTVYKLAENNEYDAATYWLQAQTKCINESKKKQGFDFIFYSSLIPDYERIGVECFRFNPNLSAFVNSQFFNMMANLTQSSQPFVEANVGSRITLASFNIASSVLENRMQNQLL